MKATVIKCNLHRGVNEISNKDRCIMELKKVTDLSHNEKTLLGKYRLCSEKEKEEIREQMQALLVQNEQPDAQNNTSNG